MAIRLGPYSTYIRAYLEYLDSISTSPEDATWDIMRDFIKHLQKSRNLSDRTAPWLKDLIDAVSVSMNEADPEKYLALCHPRFGLQYYDAIIKYIEDVQKYVPHVATSVVGGTLSDESLAICRAKADRLGVTLRVR